MGLLHKGGILLSRDLDEMKTTIHKVQCVLAERTDETALNGLEIIRRESRGRLLTLTVRGEREAVEAAMQAAGTVFYELIPLSLEEIFISETEVAGYDIKKLVF